MSTTPNPGEAPPAGDARPQPRPPDELNREWASLTGEAQRTDFLRRVSVSNPDWTPPKKVFGPEDVRRSVPVDVALPAHYGDEYEPWHFEFRVALSSAMQKQREEYLGLSQKQADEKEEGQILDELCDLLISNPTGIVGFPQENRAPGDNLRAWFTTIANPEYRQLVWAMLRAANTLYWNKVAPREFRS